MARGHVAGPAAGISCPVGRSLPPALTVATPLPAAATGVREQEAARQIKARPSVNKDSDEIALWLHGSAG